MAISAAQAAPATYWRTVTPHDSNNIPLGCRGIWVGGAGNLAAVGQDGTVITIASVPAGTVVPIAPIRINSTNTTATNIVALY